MANEGLGGLAKKWLKAKATELVTADKRTREQASYEADTTEKQLKDDAIGEAILTAVPGLRRLRDSQEAHAAAAEQRRHEEREAELAARPTVAVELVVTGAVDARWNGTSQTAVEIRRPYEQDPDDDWVDPDPFADQPTLVVDLAPITGDAASPMLGWRFEIPGYTGAGEYDLAAIGMARRAANAEPDYVDWALALDEGDLQFYFQPDTGPSSVRLSDDRRRIDVTMSTVGAHGDLAATAVLQFPEPLPVP